jgi:hypothetical protein
MKVLNLVRPLVVVVLPAFKIVYLFWAWFHLWNRNWTMLLLEEMLLLWIVLLLLLLHPLFVIDPATKAVQHG